MSPRPSVEAERRAEVLAATCDIIAEVGFRHVRIADVAARVGISTGIIHYYFRTTEELLQESFRYMTDRARARSRRALEGVADPTPGLFAVGAAKRRCSRQAHGVPAVRFGHSGSSLAPGLVATHPWVRRLRLVGRCGIVTGSAAAVDQQAALEAQRRFPALIGGVSGNGHDAFVRPGT